MRLERDEGAAIWGNSAPGKGNNPCKGPEAGRCLIVKGKAERPAQLEQREWGERRR